MFFVWHFQAALSKWSSKRPTSLFPPGFFQLIFGRFSAWVEKITKNPENTTNLPTWTFFFLASLVVGAGKKISTDPPYICYICDLPTCLPTFLCDFF
jgi:hypothetical protein